MDLADITTASAAKMPDGELLNMHRRCHMLAVGSACEQSSSAHEILQADMKRRGMQHGSPLDCGKVKEAWKRLSLEQQAEVLAVMIGAEKYAPDQPRDESGKWTEGGGGGGLSPKAERMPLYRGVGASIVDRIRKEGISRGQSWRGRAPSVYFTTDLEAAKTYAIMMNPSDDWAVVEFEVPPDVRDAIQPDEVDAKWGSKDAFRMESDIPPEWIKSIRFYDLDGSEISQEELENMKAAPSGRFYAVVFTEKSGQKQARPFAGIPVEPEVITAGITPEGIATDTKPDAKPIPGLYLAPPFGRLIHDGQMTTIAQPKRRDLTGPRVLVSGKLAYGIITLGTPAEVTTAEFDNRYEQHRVSAVYRKRKWPDAKSLWLYPIEHFIAFAEPRNVKVPAGVQTAMPKVESADGDTLTNTTVAEITTAGALAELALTGQVATGVEAQVKADDKQRSDDALAALATLPDRFVWIPDFVSLSGSTLYARDREPHDIDVIVRAQETDNRFALTLPLDAGFAIKLERALQYALGEDKQVQYSASPYGPNWQMLPLYSLCLVKNPTLELRTPNEPEYAKLLYKGGEGSGHFEHAGDPPNVGGSLPGDFSGGPSAENRRYHDESKKSAQDFAAAMIAKGDLRTLKTQHRQALETRRDAIDAVKKTNQTIEAIDRALEGKESSWSYMIQPFREAGIAEEGESSFRRFHQDYVQFRDEQIQEFWGVSGALEGCAEAVQDAGLGQELWN